MIDYEIYNNMAQRATDVASKKEWWTKLMDAIRETASRGDFYLTMPFKNFAFKLGDEHRLNVERMLKHAGFDVTFDDMDNMTIVW